jgi:L-fucose isomerase-like protein
MARVGVLFLGRKRPGFDPEWGSEVRGSIREAVKALGLDVVIPSDSVADDTAVRAAVAECAAAGATTLLVAQPTISDGKLAPIIGQLWRGGLILWATPERPTGPAISANSLVGTHVFAATLRQLGRQFELVYGHPADQGCRNDLLRAVRVTGTAASVSMAKIGLVGYHAPGFVDLHADPAALSRLLGPQLYHIGVPEFVDLVQAVDDGRVDEDVAVFRELGIPFQTGLDEQVLPVQSRVYLAIRDLMETENLASIAIRCWPEIPNLIGQWPYLAFSRLASEGVAVAMEGDVDGSLGILMGELLGLGPVYMSDWLEHDRNSITIWHTGAMPFQLCDPIGSPTGPIIAPQFNNKKPAVVDGTIRAGMEVTLYRLWRCDDRYHLSILEGRTAKPPIHLLGTNGRFETDEVDIRTWFDDMVHFGMPHHVSIVPGRHRETLRRLARSLSIDVH